MFKFLAGTIFGMFLPFMLTGAWAGTVAWSFAFFKDHLGKVMLGILALIIFSMFTGRKKQTVIHQYSPLPNQYAK